MKNSFRIYGAAVSLSRRRSLRRGTAGHDGIPRALGIMPATSYGVAFGRIMKSLARSALCALITIQIRLGSPLGKKPWFFGIKAFLFLAYSPEVFGLAVPFRWERAAKFFKKVGSSI